jgi:uncharacterized protein (TIGR02922 family)
MTVEMITVTVIFYPEDSLSPESEVLHNLPLSCDGRVIIPEEFKKGKLIIAVADGAVVMLNALGQRHTGYICAA